MILLEEMTVPMHNLAAIVKTIDRTFMESGDRLLRHGEEEVVLKMCGYQNKIQ